MEPWFYAWLRLKNARAKGAEPFTFNPDGRNDSLEYLIALMQNGPSGRTNAALIAHLEKSLEALKLVVNNLDDPSSNTTCYFIGFEDALQMLLHFLKKR